MVKHSKERENGEAQTIGIGLRNGVWIMMAIRTLH